MCGRFTYKLTWPEIVKLYRLSLDTPARNPQARHNICPTTTVDTVIGRKGVGELNDRMPVILEPEQFEAWLTGAAGLELLKPAANDVLQCWPVSRRVNSSRAPDVTRA
jgi:putative SOS response-associated peptidase YedK